MILGNVLFYPMGNTSPLSYLPSLKSGRGRSIQGTLPEFFLVAADAREFY